MLRWGATRIIRVTIADFPVPAEPLPSAQKNGCTQRVTYTSADGIEEFYTNSELFERFFNDLCSSDRFDENSFMIISDFSPAEDIEDLKILKQNRNVFYFNRTTMSCAIDVYAIRSEAVETRASESEGALSEIKPEIKPTNTCVSAMRPVDVAAHDHSIAESTEDPDTPASLAENTTSSSEISPTCPTSENKVMSSASSWKECKQDPTTNAPVNKNQVFQLPTAPTTAAVMLHQEKECVQTTPSTVASPEHINNEHRVRSDALNALPHGTVTKTMLHCRKRKIKGLIGPAKKEVMYTSDRGNRKRPNTCGNDDAKPQIATLRNLLTHALEKHDNGSVHADECANENVKTMCEMKRKASPVPCVHTRHALSDVTPKIIQPHPQPHHDVHTEYESDDKHYPRESRNCDGRKKLYFPDAPPTPTQAGTSEYIEASEEICSAERGVPRLEGRTHAQPVRNSIDDDTVKLTVALDYETCHDQVTTCAQPEYSFDTEAEEEEKADDSTRFDNGDYTGELKNNIMHGTGKFVFDNGDKYEGDFVDNVAQGRGKKTFANGNVYTGEWVDNCMSGCGTCEYNGTTGSNYLGNWKYNLPAGIGCFTQTTSLDFDHGCTSTVTTKYSGTWSVEGFLLCVQGEKRIKEEFSTKILNGTWVCPAHFLAPMGCTSHKRELKNIQNGFVEHRLKHLIIECPCATSRRS